MEKKIKDHELEYIIDSLCNFIWLGNNMQNFNTREFKQAFNDAYEKAKEVREFCEEILGRS